MNSQNSAFKNVVALFSYMLLIIAVSGFIVAFKFFGSEMVFKSLFYVIPIILAAVILIFKSQKACSKSESEEALELKLESASRLHVSGLSFIHLVFTTILLFTISIIILISFPTRPWAYFIVMSLISGLIFLQILYIRPAWTDYLIISEIIMVSLNLIWGVVLKYPLYFGATDILSHLYGINTIVQNFHITDLGADYNFPLFHIYNAIGVELTGLSLRTGLFVLMGIAWETGILFAYLLFLKFSNSRKFSLIACLLYAMSSPLILYGMYSITRSLAFVLILCCLYLIINKDNYKYVFLSLIIISALILTHHTTIFFFIPILLVVWISKKLFEGDKAGLSGLTILPIMTLSICSLSYLLYIADVFTSSILQQNLIEIMQSVEELGTKLRSPSQYFLGNISDSLFLFYSLIGIGIAMRQYSLGNKLVSFIIIGLPSLFFLIFYFSDIYSLIPKSSDLLLYRLPILVSPFIIFMVAYGLSYFIKFGRNTRQHNFKVYLPVLPVISVIMITFFSTLTSANGGDVNYVQRSADVGSTYFTESELTAFSFIKRECNYYSVLYGDHETIRDKYDLPDDVFLTKRVITEGDISYIKEGYLVLRTGELQKSGGLEFSFEGSVDVFYRYHLSQSNSPTDILNSLSVKDCVYSNSDVRLFNMNN